ncbi:hypothetical protein [Lutibacter sp.]
MLTKSYWLVAICVFVGLVAIFYTRGKDTFFINQIDKAIDLYKTILAQYKTPSEKSIQNVLQQFKDEEYEHFFVESTYDENITKWQKSNKNKKAKPIIFLKVKPRKSIPWYAVLDYSLLRKLKYIGFKPCILIYDIPYDIVNKKGLHISERELKELKQATKKYARSLVGCNTKVFFSSDFFSNTRKSAVLHDELFTYILDNFVSDSGVENANGSSYSTKNEAQLQLLGFFSIVAVKLLSDTNPTYVIQWEGRKDKWNTETVTPFLILGRTIKANGRHLNSNKCIQITFSQKELKKYLASTDDKILKDELDYFFKFLHPRANFKLQDRIQKLGKLELSKLFQEWRDLGFINSNKFSSILAEADNLKLNAYKATFEDDEILELANMKYTIVEELPKIQNKYFL